MNDEPLRELERRWTTTRDVADEARLLVERMRTSVVARSRVEIAAYLGHAPAMSALGDATPVGEYAPWGRWRAALDEAARAPFVRLAALRRFSERVDDPVASSVEAASVALKAWLACPCEADRAAARPALDGLEGELWDLPSSVYRRASELRDLLRAIVADVEESDERDDLAFVVVSLQLVRNGLELDRDQRAAREELVRWALGPAHAFMAGPVGDERAFLSTRLASGELTRERVEVAAYARSEPARELLGWPVTAPVEPVPWILGLARWSPTWALRALAEVAGNTRGEPTRDDLFQHVLAARSALRRWADAPESTSSIDLGSPRKLLRKELPGSVLVALLDCVIKRRAPDEELVARIVQAHDDDLVGHPTELGQLVRWWALRFGAATGAR